MSTQNNEAQTVSKSLEAGSCLTGHIVRPFIKDDRLIGAVMSFEGYSETALLHIRQMTGEKPAERLAELGIGDPLLVRIVIQNDGSVRRVQATEKGVEHTFLIDMLESDREKFKGIEGRVHGVTDFGVFIELLDGPAKGHRGLLRSSSLSNGGKVKLGSFLSHKVGDFVVVDLAEARLDDTAKLLLRLENARPRLAA